MTSNYIIKVRDFISSTPTLTLDALEISKMIGVTHIDFLRAYPSPEGLAEELLQHNTKSLENLIIKEVDEEAPAVESIINVSLAIYNEYDNISPEKLVFLKDLFPQIYEQHIQSKIELIARHFRNNITRGIKNKEYKEQLYIQSIINKYCQRIIEIHNNTINVSGNYSFGHIFNIIFEDYMEEVATTETWNYFRNRKQLIEVLSFGK